MPSRTAPKRQTPHPNRHENGLAVPGKKVVRQRSNTHLQAGAQGKQSVTPPSPSSSAQSIPLAPAGESQSNGPSGELKGAYGNKVAEDCSRRGSETSSDGHDVYHNAAAAKSTMEESPHRSIDVNAANNPAVHDASALSFALTILRSCPLGDTIAILIILLQLPPTILTLVQFLFATLTFFPPSSTTIASLPSLNDVFHTAGGTPSLGTIAIADVVFLIFWLFLWGPAQSFALDLTQAVIAISLGGGHAGKNGSSNSITLCVIIITISHILRLKGFRQSGLALFWSPDSDSVQQSLKSMASLPDLDAASKSTGSWLRSILAVHIISQGMVRMVRRWLARREMAQNRPVEKRMDPEAGGAQTQTGGGSLDGSEGPSASASDGAALAPPPPPKEGKERISSGKRRRKQGTLVRSQQPLWAAVASTKVIFLKEYEQSQATAEAAGAKATDITNLGNAPFGTEESRIWITHIGSTSIWFSTSNFPEEDSSSVDRQNTSGSTIDKSKHFYVRVNRADWSSTGICKLNAGEGEDTGRGARYAGEIFGLTPLSTYWCEFVRSADDVVIYEQSVITHPPASGEQALSPASPPIHQPLRPSSPTTTLKNSIAAAEATLNESRNRLKRTRKEHKSSLTSIKKEIDTLTSRLSTSGSGDERYRQRVMQINQHIRQAEDATAAMSAEIEKLGTIPEEEMHDWRAMKEHWEYQKERQTAARDELARSKAEAERQGHSAESEAATIQQKRDRLHARHTKLIEQHDRITSANAQGLDEKERRNREIAFKEAERQDKEKKYLEQIAALSRNIQETQTKSQQAWRQIHTIEVAPQQQQQQQQAQQTSASSPILVDANNVVLPAPGGPNARPPYAFPYPSFGGPLPQPIQTEPQHRGPRGRSSSMLSNISGFTDFSDAEENPFPIGAYTSDMDRQASEQGSAGSGGQVNSSHRGSLNTS